MARPTHRSLSPFFPFCATDLVGAPFGCPHTTTVLSLVRARAYSNTHPGAPPHLLHVLPRSPSWLTAVATSPTLAPSLQSPRSAPNRTSAVPTSNRRSPPHPLLTRWHAHLVTLLPLTSAPRTVGRIPRASVGRRRWGGATPRTKRDAAAPGATAPVESAACKPETGHPAAVSCPRHSWPQQRLRNGDKCGVRGRGEAGTAPAHRGWTGACSGYSTRRRRRWSLVIFLTTAVVVGGCWPGVFGGPSWRTQAGTGA